MTTSKAKSRVSKGKTPKRGYRQIMSDVHTWFGLLLGWLLFLIFSMGAVSYFNEELTIWMQPEVLSQSYYPESPTSLDSTKVLLDTISSLNQHHSEAESWYIEPPSDRLPASYLYIEENDDYTTGTFNPYTNTITQARETEGGNFFYRMHFDLHYIPTLWARLLVGFAAMMMLIALITGIIVHKKIFVDMFTFRSGKGQRSWLDAHNILSVLPLPFHLMITITGIITLASLYMPWAEKVANVGDETMYDPFYSYRPAITQEDDVKLTPSNMVSIETLIRESQQDWRRINPNYAVSSIRINNPHTNHAKIMIDGQQDKQISELEVFRVYDGVTGELLEQNSPLPLAMQVNETMIGLHAGRFSDLWLRWLYFIMGLSGSAMIATGLVLWTVKRRRQLDNPAQPHFGFILVEKLNITAIAGLPLAMSSYLWFNRLIPVSMAERASIEILGFFMVWLASFVLTLFLSPSKAWRILFALLAGSLLALPIVNLVTTDRGFLQSLQVGDWLYIGFDAFFVVSGMVFLYMAYVLHQRRISKRSSKRLATYP